MFSVMIGLVFSGLGLYFAIRDVPLEGFSRAGGKFSWSLAALAVLVYLLGHWLRGVRCRLILKDYASLSNWTGTKIIWIGYATNNILPARLGEFVRSWVLSQRENVSYGVSLSTLIIERILDGLAIVGFLWLSLPFLEAKPWLYKIGWAAGAVFGLALAVVLTARIYREQFLTATAFLLKIFPSTLRNKIYGFAEKFCWGLESLKLDLNTLKIVALSGAIWFVEAGMFATLFLSFGFPFSLSAALLTMAVTNLGVLIPSSPGHIGTFHFFCSRALLLAGIASAEASAASYAITIHLLQVLPVTLLGLWTLHSYGLKIDVLWKKRFHRDSGLSLECPPETPELAVNRE